MTLLPQTQCCALLGIDPKTLRHWLRRAQIPLIAHPTDARLRCLTEAQVQELATLHARPLVSQCLTPLVVLPQSSGRGSPVFSQTEHDSLLVLPTDEQPRPHEAESLLLQQLAALSAQVTALQGQVTQLTQELLQERQFRSEQRLATLEALLFQKNETSPTLQALQENPVGKPVLRAEPEPPEPLKIRSSRLAPLVEYTSDGSYMILSPDVGELTFLPDSPEWFAWLSTISSLHFKGQHGSFSLHRRSGRQNWQARRERNGRRYYRSLSHTKLITIAALEQIAATIQSPGPSH